MGCVLRARLVEPPPARGTSVPYVPLVTTGDGGRRGPAWSRTPLCSPGSGRRRDPASSQACSGPRLCPDSDTQLAALPPEHTVVFLLRLLPETPREPFALWQMTAEDLQPVLGVLLDGQPGGRVGACGFGSEEPCLQARLGAARTGRQEPQTGALRLGCV